MTREMAVNNSTNELIGVTVVVGSSYIYDSERCYDLPRILRAENSDIELAVADTEPMVSTGDVVDINSGISGAQNRAQSLLLATATIVPPVPSDTSQPLFNEIYTVSVAPENSQSSSQQLSRQVVGSVSEWLASRSSRSRSGSIASTSGSTSYNMRNNQQLASTPAEIGTSAVVGVPLLHAESAMESQFHTQSQVGAADTAAARTAEDVERRGSAFLRSTFSMTHFGSNLGPFSF
jgi:hypothetical protein